MHGATVKPISDLSHTHTLEVLCRIPGGMLSRTTRGRDVPVGQQEYTLWLHNPSDAVYCRLMDSLHAAIGPDGWHHETVFDEGGEIQHFRVQVGAWVPVPAPVSG